MKNPIKEHYISATGCDGTILGFIAAKRDNFKYWSGVKSDDAQYYKALLDLVVDPSPKNSQIIKLSIEKLISERNQALGMIDEARKCMDTLHASISKCEAQVEEIVNPKTSEA